jgi:hypothetical protein
MSDIVTRLRGDVSLVNVQALCRDAAGEIERFRAQLDACVRTMNACIADCQKLRQVALDGDTLVAYRLGVKHAMEGEPESMIRERVATSDMSPTHVAESPEEQQEPFAWAADIPGKFGGAPTVLFGYTEKLVRGIAAAGGDLVQPFPLYRQPQTCPYVVGRTTLHCSLTPLTLTDAERDAVKLAAEWFASVPLGDTLRSLLERTK